MTTTPSSNSDWAWGFALGNATGAIGFEAAPRPAARGPPHAARPQAAAPITRSASAPRLLITADLLHALERDARLAEADRRAQLGLLRGLGLRQARERGAGG